MGSFFKIAFVSISLLTVSCAQPSNSVKTKKLIEPGMYGADLRSALLYTVSKKRDPYGANCFYEYDEKTKTEIRSSLERDYFYVLEKVQFNQGCSGTGGHLKFVANNYASTKKMLEYGSAQPEKKASNSKDDKNYALVHSISDNNLVTSCISKNLIPGTSLFSECIANSR